MQLTIIFRNQSQVDILQNFTAEDIKAFEAAAKTRRAVVFNAAGFFVDFSEVIFYIFKDTAEE